MDAKKWFWLSGGSYATEYKSILNRATALGYTLPSSDQMAKQNALLVALKAANIWDSLDVFYCFANNGSKEFATLNWKSPSTFQCAMVNSPTFTSNVGFTFNGTTQYLDTTLIPIVNTTNFVRNSASEFGHITDYISGLKVFSGVYDSGTGYLTSIATNGTSVYFGANNSAGLESVVVTAWVQDRLYHSQRTGLNTTAIFRNGVSIGTDTETSVNYAGTYSFRVGGRGGAVPLFAPCTSKCYGIGDSLTGKETSLSTAWTNYLTSI